MVLFWEKLACQAIKIYAFKHGCAELFSFTLFVLCWCSRFELPEQIVFGRRLVALDESCR